MFVLLYGWPFLIFVWDLGERQGCTQTMHVQPGSLGKALEYCIKPLARMPGGSVVVQLMEP